MFYKKLSFIVGIALMSQAAMAINPSETIETDGIPYLIPDFVLSNEASAVMYFEDDTDEKTTYKLYSKNLEEIGNLSFDNFSYTEKVKYQMNCPILNISYVYNGDAWGSESDFENYFDDRTQKLSVENVVFFFKSDYIPSELAKLTTVESVEQYLVSTPYCNEYAIWDKTTGQSDGWYGLTSYRAQDMEIVGYTDEIIDIDNLGEEADAVSGTYPLEINTTDGHYVNEQVEISQTLFNDDEDYEALIPMREFGTVSRNETYYGEVLLSNGFELKVYGGFPVKRISETWVQNGFQVVKANGKGVVATFEIPENYVGGEYVMADLYKLGSRLYLFIMTRSEATRATLIYDITEMKSGVQTPMLIEEVRVRPTIVNRGDNINIEVGGNTEIESVDITDMKGTTRRVASASGKRSVAVGTGNLSRGMHIVSVKTANGAKPNASKVVIR